MPAITHTTSELAGGDYSLLDFNTQIGSDLQLTIEARFVGTSNAGFAAFRVGSPPPAALANNPEYQSTLSLQQAQRAPRLVGCEVKEEGGLFYVSATYETPVDPTIISEDGIISDDDTLQPPEPGENYSEYTQTESLQSLSGTRTFQFQRAVPNENGLGYRIETDTYTTNWRVQFIVTSTSVVIHGDGTAQAPPATARVIRRLGRGARYIKYPLTLKKSYVSSQGKRRTEITNTIVLTTL